MNVSTSLNKKRTRIRERESSLEKRQKSKRMEKRKDFENERNFETESEECKQWNEGERRREEGIK